jgi:RNA polymerase sigma-70 factor (ECF subfamily)
MAYKAPRPRPGQREERALFMGVKNGKAEAFDTFYERHAAPLYSLALAMAARPDAAAEIVEAAFHKALQRSASWPEARTLESWLSELTVEAGNRHLRPTREKPPERPARNRRRRGGPRREKSRRVAPPENPLPRRPVTDWSAAAGEEPLRERLRELAGSAGPRLPELLRASWALVDRNGLSPGEAGEILGLSPAMVWSRVHRARLRIREDLARAASAFRPESGPGDTPEGSPGTGPGGDSPPQPGGAAGEGPGG